MTVPPANYWPPQITPDGAVLTVNLLIDTACLAEFQPTDSERARLLEGSAKAQATLYGTAAGNLSLALDFIAEGRDLDAFDALRVALLAVKIATPAPRPRSAL